MIDTAFYLTSADIARRAGVARNRYRTADGRYILDNKDLSRVRLTAAEYATGLRGVQMITEQEAKELIERNSFTFGGNVEPEPAPVPTPEPTPDEGPDTLEGETAEEAAGDSIEGAAAPSEDAAEEAAIPSQQTEQEEEDAAPAEGENENENENLEEDDNDGNNQ